MATMGVEVEIAGLSPSALKFIDFIEFSTHDDGSIRGPTYVVDGVPIVFNKRQHGKSIDYSNNDVIIPSGCNRYVEPRHYGLELVTVPYEYEELYPKLERLAKILGHVPMTTTSSIHIHIDVADKPWIYIQSVLKWAYYFEAVIYKVASSGGRHRGGNYEQNGDYNDYRFARPLSDSIGVQWITPSGRSVNSYLVKIGDLLSSNTASELAASWGRLDLFWGYGDSYISLGHYTPHRLQFINLSSVLRQGTLEWRVFDGCYRNMHRFLEFVHKFHNLAEKYPDPVSVLGEDFKPMILGYNLPKSHRLFSDLLGMDLSPLWGSDSAWPKPIESPHKRHHYGSIDVPTLSNRRILLISNNGGQLDDGTKLFTMFTRRAVY